MTNLPREAWPLADYALAVTDWIQRLRDLIGEGQQLATHPIPSALPRSAPAIAERLDTVRHQLTATIQQLATLAADLETPVHALDDALETAALIPDPLVPTPSP